MNVDQSSHPGYLYQISSTGEGDFNILKATCGLKEKERTLYLYLTPSQSPSTPESSLANPFNNYRLRSIMEDADIVVFDSPPEEAKGFEDNILFNLLKTTYSQETLVRMNNDLTRKLESRNIDLSKLDQKVGDDHEMLAELITVKCIIFYAKGLGLKLPSGNPSEPTSSFSSAACSSSTDCPVEPVAPSAKLSPKELIHRVAQDTGKSIEYIDGRSDLERHKELLSSDNGVLEFFLCSVFTDQELMQNQLVDQKNDNEKWSTGTVIKSDESLFERYPKLIAFKENTAVQKWATDSAFQIAKKITTCLSGTKKALFVLETNPKIFGDVARYVKAFSYRSKVEIKGPIKEPTGCFWKIKKKLVTVGYLLGSIHLTPKHLQNLNSRIRKCVDKSARLAVEIDVTRQSLVDKRIQQMKDEWNERYDKFTPEQIDNIVNALKIIFPDSHPTLDFNDITVKKGFILSSVHRLKSKIFEDLELFSGIDHKLIEQAKTNRRPVEDLETIEQRDHIRSSLKIQQTPELWHEFFFGVLSSEEVKNSVVVTEIIDLLIQQASQYTNELFKPLFDAWEEGDLEKMDTSKSDSTEHRMSMVQRNLNMSMRIVELVNTGEKIFSCVGAAHTVGEMNIQAFLHNFGLTTERVFV